MAAGDLTSLEAVKEWLGLTSEDDDALLFRLLSAASAFIQSEIGYEVASQAYTEVRDGLGGDRLVFAHSPVTAVSSVKVDGVAIPAASGPTASGYKFTPTLLYLRGYSFSRGVQNVELAYTAGYAATPADLERACIELVGLRYKEKDRIGQTSMALGGGQTVAFMVKDVPDSVKTVLKGYKKVVPV